MDVQKENNPIYDYKVAIGKRINNTFSKGIEHKQEQEYNKNIKAYTIEGLNQFKFDLQKSFEEKNINEAYFNKSMNEINDLKEIVIKNSLGHKYTVFVKEDNIKKANFDTKERKKLAKEGEAMPDGSFPIASKKDLIDAIHDIGRANDPEKAKSWIKKRAKELDLEKLLPAKWKNKKEDKIEKSGMEPTMKEFKEGTLEDSHGNKVTNRKQAIAIGMSENKEMKKSFEWDFESNTNPILEQRNAQRNNIQKGISGIENLMTFDQLKKSNVEIYLPSDIDKYKDDLKKSLSEGKLGKEDFEKSISNLDNLVPKTVYNDKNKQIDVFIKAKKISKANNDNLEKGVISDTLGRGYGNNNKPIEFVKTGKELKEKLPTTISFLENQLSQVEAKMTILEEKIGYSPTQNNSSNGINYVNYSSDKCYAPYDSSLGKYTETTDEMKLCCDYNSMCWALCSIKEDILACKVILANVNDSNKYTLSVSQLIALNFQ